MTPPERSVEVTHKILGNIELILIEKRLDGSDIADIWERLNPTIEHTLHQELQKAREEERERIWNEAQKLRIEADDCSDESFTEGEFYLHMGGLDSILNPKD